MGQAAWSSALKTGGTALWVNVMDYGAVGDDTANDTTAIQDALDATPQGGVCYFPVGTYKITAALSVPHTMRLLGAESPFGTYTKVRQATADTTAFLGPTTGSQHWAIDGLQVTGTIGGQSAGYAIYTTQSVNIRRCRTQGFYDGLHVYTDGTGDDAVYYSTVEESLFDSATRAGIYLAGHVNNFTMRGGRAVEGAYGLRVTGGPLGLRLRDADFGGTSTAAVSIDGDGGSQSTAGVLISGCYFETLDGEVDLEIGPATTVYNVRVESCVFIKSGLAGTGYHIDADKVEGLTVTDCYFTSDDVLTTTANTDGIIWANNINSNAGTVTLQTSETLILDPAASVAPEDIGSTDAGTSAYPARADHVHGGGSAGTPATTVESETTWGITPAVGSDTEYARQDHTHGSPAQPSSGGVGAILISDSPSTPLVFADLIQNEAQDDLVYADP